LKASVTGKLFSCSQKKHKPIMRLWSRTNLSLRKTGIRGPGTSAGLSRQSTIIPGTLARMASFRCWCAWEPGTAAPWPGVQAASLAGGAGGAGGGEYPMNRCPWVGKALWTWWKPLISFMYHVCVGCGDESVCLDGEEGPHFDGKE